MQIVEQSFFIETPLNNIRNMLPLIERAGRVCYKSEAKIQQDSATDFVKMIIKRGHESVLEHQSISVRFICDRGISHEIVRHRIASYSQESTRYCDYAGKGIQLIHPAGLTDAQVQRREALFNRIQAVYDLERVEGVSPQIARGVLPTCLKTELIMTANLREWRHFFKLRCSTAAHPQMRLLALDLKAKLVELLPAVFEDL